MYVEKVTLGLDSYVIGSGLYPISKRETMILLAKSAASYLRTNDSKKTFFQFTEKNGKFVRGDLQIFTFDANGICFAYGDDYNLVWRNLLNVKDDNGKPYIQMFINTVKRGAGSATYTLNGVTKTVYLEPVEREGKLFVVGSGYYL